ncbi:MAG: hypothetical protein JSR82_20045 [Verrucomicrobia bacterium]|nr:hypothetical protein [Verrucomicrobiota bacterium]
MLVTFVALALQVLGLGLLPIACFVGLVRGAPGYAGLAAAVWALLLWNWRRLRLGRWFERPPSWI